MQTVLLQLIEVAVPGAAAGSHSVLSQPGQPAVVVQHDVTTASVKAGTTGHSISPLIRSPAASSACVGESELNERQQRCEQRLQPADMQSAKNCSNVIRQQQGQRHIQVACLQDEHVQGYEHHAHMQQPDWQHTAQVQESADHQQHGSARIQLDAQQLHNKLMQKYKTLEWRAYAELQIWSGNLEQDCTQKQYNEQIQKLEEIGQGHDKTTARAADLGERHAALERQHSLLQQQHVEVQQQLSALQRQHALLANHAARVLQIHGHDDTQLLSKLEPQPGHELGCEVPPGIDRHNLAQIYSSPEPRQLQRWLRQIPSSRSMETARASALQVLQHARATRALHDERCAGEQQLAAEATAQLALLVQQVHALCDGVGLPGLQVDVKGHVAELQVPATAARQEACPRSDAWMEMQDELLALKQQVQAAAAALAAEQEEKQALLWRCTELEAAAACNAASIPALAVADADKRQLEACCHNLATELATATKSMAQVTEYNQQLLARCSELERQLLGSCTAATYPPSNPEEEEQQLQVRSETLEAKLAAAEGCAAQAVAEKKQLLARMRLMVMMGHGHAAGGRGG